MKHTSPPRNLLIWRIAALLSLALIIVIGAQLDLTTGKKIVFLIVFGAGAFFLIQRKIFDARVIFALGGVGLALVFGSLSPALGEARRWSASFIAIPAAYGFAALIMSEGFIKEFASILAEYGVGNRSSPFALFLTTSFIVFVVNAIVMSAGSSCAVVAPIFVMLLIRLGFPAPVAAASVVIGAWGGFLNLADTGGSAITDAFEKKGLEMYSILGRHIGPALLALVAANITLALMNRRKRLNGQSTKSLANSGKVTSKRSGRARVIIFILPFLLLIPLEILAWFLQWNPKGPFRVEYRLTVCLAVASIAASVVVARDLGRGEKKVLTIAKVFSGGMWKGFAEVVVLIAAAKLFIFPYKEIVLPYGKGAVSAANLALVSVPAAFLASVLTGSGDAVVSSLAPVVVGWIGQQSPVPSMLWLATEMGRNVSPISAATITCAKAASKEKDEIDGAAVARHVLIPLIVGLVVGCSALYVVFKVFK